MPDDWDTLSDDEKSALVAETVFGFRISRGRWTKRPLNYWPPKSPEFWSWRSRGYRGHKIPDYLHDPRLVFGEDGVVAKMKEAGWLLRVWDHEEFCEAGFIPLSALRGVVTTSFCVKAVAPALLEAVCHAAYEAVKALKGDDA